MSDAIGESLTQWERRDVEHWCAAWRIPKLVGLRFTGSTNDVARSLAEAGAPAGTTVIADEQRAGRGQKGRAWLSPPGRSLLMSVVLRSDQPGADPSSVPIRVGLAACTAIYQSAGVRARIKWPNDLVIEAGDARTPGTRVVRKVAGILCEGATARTSGLVIAGIGINVSQSESDWPAPLRETATSLGAVTNRAIDRAALAGALLDALRPFRFTGEPLDAGALTRFREVDVLFAKDVEVDGSPAGIAGGITEDGALIVRNADTTHTIRSGTVRLAPSNQLRNSS